MSNNEQIVSDRVVRVSIIQRPELGAAALELLARQQAEAANPGLRAVAVRSVASYPLDWGRWVDLEVSLAV